MSLIFSVLFSTFIPPVHNNDVKTEAAVEQSKIFCLFLNNFP